MKRHLFYFGTVILALLAVGTPASADVFYSFSGSVHDQDFSLQLPTTISSSMSFSASELTSCATTALPCSTVKLSPTGFHDYTSTVWWDLILFTEQDGSQAVYLFPLGTLSSLGTFQTSSSYFGQGTLMISEVPTGAPEPAALILLGTGLLCMAGALRRKQCS